MGLPFDIDPAPGTVARLGLMVLQEDRTLENDLRAMLPEGDIALYASRVESLPDVSADGLAQMAQTLPRAAGLMPEGVEFDAVAYGCTSGTAVIGAEKVAGLIREGCNAAAVTEPLSALLAACDRLGIRRLAFLSPYVAEVSAVLRAKIAAGGVEITGFASFEEGREAMVPRISERSIFEGVLSMDLTGAQGVFLSCTNLRTLSVIEQLEARTGLPVLSSNLVLGWHLGRLTGLRMSGGGRLMQAQG